MAWGGKSAKRGNHRNHFITDILGKIKGFNDNDKLL